LTNARTILINAFVSCFVKFLFRHACDPKYVLHCSEQATVPNLTVWLLDFASCVVTFRRNLGTHLSRVPCSNTRVLR